MGRGGGLTGCIFCLLVDGPITSRADEWGGGGRGWGTYKRTFRVS